MSSVKRDVGFVQQEDLMASFVHLTVREVLTVAALLRRPCTSNKEEYANIVNGTLGLLSLMEVQDTQLGLR